VVLALALLALGLLAALVPALTPRLGRDTGYVLAAGFLGVGALLVAEMPGVLRGDVVEVAWQWLPSLDVAAALRLDGLSMLFALLVLGVGALIMAYCARYLEAGRPHTRWYVLLTLFGAAMLGLLLADDLVLLFAFWELTTVTSFLLISTTGPDAGPPATRALLVTGGGGLALLAAVVLVGTTAGTTDLTAILAEPEVVLESPLAGPIALLVIVAAITKSAQLPFHFWLPDAMVAITPVSAYLHAATMVKAGVYLLMRFSPLFADQPAWVGTLLVIGLTTAIVGALLALRQYDLKALLAYSTVSQLGLLVATTGLGTPEALGAGSVHLLAHALFKATLFMLVGIIDHEAGSRDIRELSGLRRVMPVTATLTGLAALSLAGVPPLIGFVSKESIFEAMLGAPGPDWAGVVAGTAAVTASVLTFAYAARIFYDAFGGRTLQERLYEPSFAFLAPAAVPALLGLALGPGVAVLNPLIASAVSVALPGMHTAELEFWHGFTAEVWMSLATMAVGTVLFLARRRVSTLLRAFPLRVHGSGAFDRVHGGLIAVGALVARPSRDLRLTAHLPWPVLTGLGLAVVGGLAIDGLPAHPVPVTGPLDVPVLVLLAAAVGTLALTRWALAAVGLLGVTGLVVATWFLLVGAPDLALALLLVEILTVVVAILVLRGRRARFPAGGIRRAVGAGGLALAAGVAAGAATFAFTGRREITAAGQFFLDEAERLAGGTNVVNTVLVDFRALDTLGELTVLLAVALGLLALLDPARRPIQTPGGAGPAASLDLVAGGGVLAVAGRVLVPVMLVVSGYLLLRGHDHPGGGFSGALVGGVAIALWYLARGSTASGGSLPPEPLIASGLLLSVTVGVAVLGAGLPLLTPVGIDFGPVSTSSSLIFDLGVYVAVLGLIAAAVVRLGGRGGDA
jgi:multicomponent Na+:H+ antiporter subunit A